MPTTRSSTKAARVQAATTDASLADQPPEILNLVGDALAADEDALQPRHLGALSRSCKVVKAAVKDSLAKVKVEYEAARALCNKCGVTVEWIVAERPELLESYGRGLTAADMPALVSMLKSKALMRLEQLILIGNKFGDEGAAAIAAAAVGGGLPLLKYLSLADNQIGDSGMQALAAAFADGAFSELEWLSLGGNAIGDAGLTALAATLEKGVPALKALRLHKNRIGDEGVKALMAAAGGGGLAKLERLDIDQNEYDEAGLDAMAEAIEKANLPSLQSLYVDREHRENPRLVAACEQRGVELRS